MTKKKKEKEGVVDNSLEIKYRQYYLLGGTGQGRGNKNKKLLG